jgi:predicted transcriptional regulator with HTH domain
MRPHPRRYDGEDVAAPVVWPVDGRRTKPSGLPHTPTMLNADLELSMRRSPKRRLVLLMLSSLSESRPLALAKACGVDAQRLAWIMHGRWPYYRPELSLVALGLAEDVETSTGRVYRITQRGRRKSRQLTARQVRKEVARRAVQEHVEGARDRAPYAATSAKE